MTEIQKLAKKMEDLARFVVPSSIFDENKANEYYKVKKLYNKEKTKINNNVFVNSYNEATKREICSSSYKRQQNKLSKQIIGFIS